MTSLQSVDDLVSEANSFHQAMFGRLASKNFTQYYVRANQECPTLNANQMEIDEICTLIRAGANITNIESALRDRKKRHPLVKKMILISYLSECDGAHIESFRPSNRRFQFWLTLPFWGLRALFRKFLGKLSLERYGI